MSGKSLILKTVGETGRGGTILKAVQICAHSMNHFPGVKELRSGVGHPQGWACDREKRETQKLTSNYLLVCCSTLTGLEQHLISQTGGGLGGGDQKLQTDLVGKLDLSSL